MDGLYQIDDLETMQAVQADVAGPEAGPRRTASLKARASTLAQPEVQLEQLDALPMAEEFDAAVRRSGHIDGLRPGALQIFQINLGKLCNMSCRHCHVDSGPDRVEENMDRATVDACLRAIDLSGANTVDLTGGAPELNPNFRYLVDACVERGKHVIDRCNLTVLLLPRNRDLVQFLADRGVEVVCSLPHYRKRNTDAQRGEGTYEKSIKALRLLNEAGYGKGDPTKLLTLMANPAGAYLAADQSAVEAEWKAALLRNHHVSFDRLFCLNNMPVSRYLEWLIEKGQLEAYMQRLTQAFNPAAIGGLMCLNTLSVSWDGRLFDCDFNQMLDLDVEVDGATPTVHGFDLTALKKRQIVTRRHCFGCTAGQGSSCGGATS